MTRRWHPLRKLGALLLLLSGAHLLAQEQIVDPNFTATVDAPAYKGEGPTVAIDEAHSNFHTAAGRYRPLCRATQE